MILSLLKPLLLSALGYVVYRLFDLFVWQPYRSPLRRMRGPPTTAWNDSHMKDVMLVLNSRKRHEEWSKTYGKTFCIWGMSYVDKRFFTLDPVAMNYILTNPLIYEKPWQSRNLISRVIGEGLLSSEGNHHRKQRKVMNPAFSQTNIKRFLPVFQSKAHELRRRWTNLIEDPAKGETIDMVSWISRATFDVIGLTGFDYAFNAIQNEDNEVYLAYKHMFEKAVTGAQQNFREFMGIFWPTLDKFWPTRGTRIIKSSHKIIYGVGNALVQSKKKEYLEGKVDETKTKSLLSLLIQSNLMNTVPSQQISDSDIMDQINTFFFAGSDTTSLALGYAFMLLADFPEWQDKLRNELIEAAPDHDPDDEWDVNFSMVDNLPILDKVAKEVLRVIPPVHSSIRVALKDDVIPLKYPITLKDGTEVTSFPINKGEFMHVPMEGFNLDKDVWGEDAWEFNPARWDNLPALAKEQPGLWQNIMTFGAGPRSCIGMRFSIMEMKTFMFVLLRALTFERVPDTSIAKISIVLTRPYVRGRFGEGSQLPLIVKPYVPPSSK